MSYSRLAVWVMASRPKTLWAALAPVIMGTAIAYGDGGFHWLSALMAALGAVMIQIGTNFTNDYFDYKKGSDSRDRLGPTRVTQAGLVTPGAMKKAILVAFTVALLIGCYLVWRGGWPIVTIGLFSILFGLAYTAGPYPLGYNGLGDIFVLIFFGPVAVGGTYYVQTLTIEPAVLLIGLAPGLFSVAILTVNNLRDLSSDRAAGKNTLAVRFGASFARWEYTSAIIIASLLPSLMYLMSGRRLYSSLTILLAIVALPSIRKVFALVDAPELNEVLATTGKLLLLYSLVFACGWLL